MPTAETAQEIRRRMAAVRREMDESVDEIVENARELVDWRYYVKTYPWATVAVAAAAGYMVVPRKLHVMRPDAATLAQLAKEHRLVVENETPEARSPGFIGSVVTMAGSLAMRAALAYVGQQMGKIVAQEAAEPTPQTESRHR